MITVQKASLVKGLDTVARAVAGRSTLPVLGCILLAVDGERLRLQATDLSTALTCWVGAKVEGDGALAAPAKTLIDVVKAMPDGDLEICFGEKENKIRLQAGRDKAEVKGIDAQEFPIVPRADQLSETRLEVPVADLRAAINRTIFCAATTESARPVLAGVRLHAENGRAAFAAVDGFRLAEAVVQVGDGNLSAIIPAIALERLGYALPNDAETVALYAATNGNQVGFASGPVEMIAQLVEGQFPDFTHAFQHEWVLNVEVSAAELRAALKAVNVFARENDGAGACLTVEDGCLLLNAVSPLTGQGEARVKAKSGASELLKIKLSAKYLLDALGAISGDCTLHLADPRKPALITAGDNLRYVIMPMASG